MTVINTSNTSAVSRVANLTGANSTAAAKGGPEQGTCFTKNLVNAFESGWQGLQRMLMTLFSPMKTDAPADTNTCKVLYSRDIFSSLGPLLNKVEGSNFIEALTFKKLHGPDQTEPERDAQLLLILTMRYDAKRARAKIEPLKVTIRERFIYGYTELFNMN
jgi:hypothetical protein